MTYTAAINDSDLQQVFSMYTHVLEMKRTMHVLRLTLDSIMVNTQPAGKIGKLTLSIVNACSFTFTDTPIGQLHNCLSS